DLVCTGQFSLAHAHHFRLAVERYDVLAKLFADSVVVVDRVAAVRRKWLNEVNEYAGAFNVPQKFVTEADALRRAFDEPRQVCQDESCVTAECDNAEVRMLRRERIRGNFRGRATEAREQCGFACIRESD